MDAFWAWLQSPDQPFAFLVVLPFFVIAVAWVGDLFRQRLRRNRHQ